MYKNYTNYHFLFSCQVAGYWQNIRGSQNYRSVLKEDYLGCQIYGFYVVFLDGQNNSDILHRLPRSFRQMSSVSCIYSNLKVTPVCKLVPVYKWLHLHLDFFLFKCSLSTVPSCQTTFLLFFGFCNLSLSTGCAYS